MPLRLFFILTLLIQQFALPAAMVRGDATGCENGACCEVVETITCCGETTLEMRCGKSGGECLCGLTPGDSEPVPAAPAPEERGSFGPLFVAVLGSAIHEAAPVRTQSRRAAPVVHRTHNETQALLCIWRT